MKIKELLLKAAIPFKFLVEKIHYTITVFALISGVVLVIPQLYRILDNVGPEQWPYIPGVIGGITLITAIFILWKKA